MADRARRFLVVYSGLLTVVLGVVLLVGAAGSGKAVFGEIDVQRLNLREPDGTLRYVLSSSSRFPGAIIRGKEYPHPRPQAGMLFYNDEGTEVGGLAFAGARNWRGAVRSGASLSFDRYEQDQIVQIMGYEQGGRQVAGLQVFDRPRRSIVEDFREQPRLRAMRRAERRALMEQRQAENYYAAGRLFAGRNAAGEAILRLQDGNGGTRIRLLVEREGAAAIEFLDAAGEVTHRLTPHSPMPVIGE